MGSWGWIRRDRKKAIGCGMLVLFVAGAAAMPLAKRGWGGRGIPGGQAGILTPAWEEGQGQLPEGGTWAWIPGGEVPLAAGPGPSGPGGGLAEYAQPAVSESPYVRQVINLVNEERQKAGLPVLEKADDASAAAAVRARELVASFSHTRPDGSAYRTALEQSGASFRSCGENVAYGYRTPEAVMSAWMSSDGHRDNILNEKYTDIGVGYFTDGSGQGYWAQIFTAKK